MAQCTDRMDGMDRDQIRNAIEQGNTALGIEFGSTRIKAVLVDGKNKPIAQGSYDWENRFEEGIWTYRLADAQTGLISCFRSLKEDVNKKYDITLHTIGAMGVSAMMHGYMAFDQNQKLLVPFRTWRNTMTAAASQKLTEIFHFPIPQRWSIAHLYQAILNGEKHVDQIRYLTTLDGYIHWKLTGQKVIGIGQASGMFPIDTEQKDYRKDLAERFDQLVADKISMEGPGHSSGGTDGWSAGGNIDRRRSCFFGPGWRSQGRNSHVSAGRRCGHWNGGDQQC